MTPDDIWYLIHHPAPPDDSQLSELYAVHEHAICTRLNYYVLLHNLVMALKPKVALEIGVEYGLASAYMCCAAYEYGGHVIGVDWHKHDVPAERIPGMYPNTYNYIVSDSTMAVPQVESYVYNYGKIGVVFQDSSHHYRESVMEWNMYRGLLAPGAVWLCDDIMSAFHDPKVDPPGVSMVNYFDELPGEKMLIPDVLHKGNVIGVVLL